MRRSMAIILPLVFLVVAFSASAATGRIVKVLPTYLDLKGRQSLSPSLYDRDAYQAQLRQRPEERSGMRFDVLWRARGQQRTTLKLRAELRGTVKGNLPSQTVLEKDVRLGATGIAGRWSTLKFAGEDYKKFGEVSAWRVTLWNGDQLVAEQNSFLW